MLELLDLLFGFTPNSRNVVIHAPAKRAAAPNRNADALHPFWPATRLELPSSPPWNPAQSGMQAGFGDAGGTPNYGATLPVGV
jgi:hypothetical protein